MHTRSNHVFPSASPPTHFALQHVTSGPHFGKYGSRKRTNNRGRVYGTGCTHNKCWNIAVAHRWYSYYRKQNRHLGNCMHFAVVSRPHAEQSAVTWLRAAPQGNVAIRRPRSDRGVRLRRTCWLGMAVDMFVSRNWVKCKVNPTFMKHHVLPLAAET
jgi:hypothetical protein